MDKSAIRRQRAPKTTAEQYEVFLDFATLNPSVGEAKRDTLENDQAVLAKWDELTAILNSGGRGPQRASREWQITFSNWRNSIRHKLKCVADGSSRSAITELEGRALQLWDLTSFNGLVRYSRKRDSAGAHALSSGAHKLDDYDDASGGGGAAGPGQNDESTQSSLAGAAVPSYYGRPNAGGMSLKKEELDDGDYDDYDLQFAGDVALEPQQRQHFNGTGSDGAAGGNGAGSHYEHSTTASVTAVDDDDDCEGLDDGESSSASGGIQRAASAADGLMAKRKKLDDTQHAAEQRQHKFQSTPLLRRNGNTPAGGAAPTPLNASSGAVAGGKAARRPGSALRRRGSADEPDGTMLIADSIGKLAENIGHMAESIRDIAAAFTTTTHAAFDLIRRQSEIIQALIERS